MLEREFRRPTHHGKKTMLNNTASEVVRVSEPLRYNIPVATSHDDTLRGRLRAPSNESNSIDEVSTATIKAHHISFIKFRIPHVIHS